MSIKEYFRLKNYLFGDPAAANVTSLLGPGKVAEASDALETCVGSHQEGFSAVAIFVA